MPKLLGLQIGRVGRDAEGPVVYLSAAENWKVSGNEVSIDGHIHANDVTESTRIAHALGVRDQLMGYVGNLDEPFVPVSWDLDPNVAGFYAITGADVDFNSAISLTKGIFPFSVSMAKLSNYSFATVESVVRGWVRSNKHGFTNTSCQPWLGTPDDKVQYIHGPSGTTWDQTIRKTATGDISIATSDLHSYIATYSIRPESWLNGACSIDVPYRAAGCEPSGGAWVSAVGERCPLDPMAWRISNGIISVMPKKHPSGVMMIELRYFAEDQNTHVPRWLPTPKRYEIVSSAGTFGTYDYIAIIRNSPEQVTIRIGMQLRDFTPGTSGRYLMDLTLKRGARYLQMYFQSDRVSNWDVTSYEAETAVVNSSGAGIHAASPNADGVTYLVVTGKDFEISDGGNLSQGGIVTADGVQITGVGVGFQPPNPSGYDWWDDVERQYFSINTERVIYSAQEVDTTNIT